MRYFRTGIRTAVLLAGAFVFATALLAQGQQLTLNPHLDYNSDSVDGPLITGNDTQTGVIGGKQAGEQTEEVLSNVFETALEERH